MRQSQLLTLLLIVTGSLIGVAVGACCAWQDEVARKDELVESRRIEPTPTPKKPRKPWLNINGAPPTQFHYCLFFGAWGGLIGVLVAAGGNWVFTIPAGIFGGVFGLITERAANGLMFDRGFITPHDPKAALIFAIAFLSATLAAFYTSLEDRKQARKKLRDPD